ncbi:MAG TPA: VOC family protein [Caulobacteraceae bacterium]|jgi:uncharacterized glyoxalase superfamily protein PhnB
MTETLHSAPAQAKPKGGVNAYLAVDGAVKAAEFYRRAFGAELAAINPVDDKGRTMHIHLYVNGSSVMLGDYYPEHGHGDEGHAGFTMILHVDDIDAAYKRAVDAGATPGQPITEMFWGDRYGSVKDPFGVTWAMNEAKA